MRTNTLPLISHYDSTHKRQRKNIQRRVVKYLKANRIHITQLVQQPNIPFTMTFCADGDLIIDGVLFDLVDQQTILIKE